MTWGYWGKTHEDSAWHAQNFGCLKLNFHCQMHATGIQKYVQDRPNMCSCNHLAALGLSDPSHCGVWGSFRKGAGNQIALVWRERSLSHIAPCSGQNILCRDLGNGFHFEGEFEQRFCRDNSFANLVSEVSTKILYKRYKHLAKRSVTKSSPTEL